jgi:hypothetical protein
MPSWPPPTLVEKYGLYKVTAACVPWLLQEDHICCMPEPGLILGRESIPVVPYQDEDEVIES